MNFNRKWAFACVLTLGTAAGLTATGCGDDSTTPTVTPGVDSGPKTDSSTPGVDSGPKPGVDGGSLLDHLGGLAGVQNAVKHVVEDSDGLAGDAQILSYFAIRTGGGISTTATGGDPSLQAVEDCFSYFVASAAANAGEAQANPYPTTVDAGGSATFTCRAMGPAHTGLGITATAFSTFVTIAAAKLASLGVGTTDLSALGTALLGTSTDIVDPVRTVAVGDGGVGSDMFDSGLAWGASCATISADNQDAGIDAALTATKGACDPSH